MKKIINNIAVAAMAFLLVGCGLYNKYDSNVPVPADAYGRAQGLADAPTDGSLADMSWRTFFTDPLLQQLIDRVLANNTDLNSARIAIEKSEASLTGDKVWLHASTIEIITHLPCLGL